MKTFLYIAIVIICRSICAQSLESEFQKKIDSLKMELDFVKQDTTRCNLLNSLYSEEKSEELKTNYNELLKKIVLAKFKSKSLSSIERTFYKKEFANIRNHDAYSFYNSGNISQAKDIYLANVDFCRQINYKKAAGIAYNNLGYIYMYELNYKAAISAFINSLKIKEDIKDSKGMANTYMNLAVIYYQQKNSEEAITYLKKCLSIAEMINEPSIISKAQYNIGVGHYGEKKYSEALKWFQKCLITKEKMNDLKDIGMPLIYIGAIYINTGKSEEGYSCINRALDITKEKNDKVELVESLSIIASCLNGKGFENRAEIYAKEALKYAKEIKYFSGILNNSEILYDINKKRKNYKEALDMYEICIKAYDSIVNKENYIEISSQRLVYEQEKKQRAFDLFKKEKELKEQIFKTESEKNQKQKVILTSILVFFSLTIIVVVFVYKQKLKTNQIIAIKNQEISKQQANVSGQMIERERIAKDLHDGIGGTLAVIKLNLERLNTSNEIQPKIEGIVRNLDDACKEIRTISHNLSSSVLSQEGSFIDLLKTTISMYSTPANIKTHFDYFPENELNVLSLDIKEVIYRLLQELFHNIVKHAKANKVDISISKQENMIYIMIEDNGIGFNNQDINKGIGLNNIKSRIKILNGEMNIDSKKGRGTIVSLSIPYTSI